MPMRSRFRPLAGRIQPLSMDSIWVIASTVIGAWKGASYVASMVEEQWLLETQRQKLTNRFTTWWFSVQEMGPWVLAIAVARGVSDILGTFFGERVFSKKAFKLSATIGTTLLLGCIAASALTGKDIRPWRELSEAINVTKRVAESEIKEQSQTASELAELRRTIRDTAVRFDTLAWRITYSTAFYLFIGSANAITFFLSIALSRLILREVVASGRIFTAGALFAPRNGPQN